jgi:hypothetical protein
MNFRSAFFWALLPDGHVLLDDRGHEVVEAFLPSRRKGASVVEVDAQVGVVPHRFELGPWPNKSGNNRREP